jgi:ATP-dependent RNA helicase RhlE
LACLVEGHEVITARYMRALRAVRAVCGHRFRSQDTTIMNSVSQVPQLHSSSISGAAPTTVPLDRFERLALVPTLLRAVREQGYEHPTPIQMGAIPHVLEGKDLLGCAQTGTGKTAAFALPILQRLLASRAGKEPLPKGWASQGRRQSVRALVLSPTRELAAQIASDFETYGKYTGLRVGVIFGGVSQHGQEQMLRRGPDILVATPGRLLDLMQQRLIQFSEIEVFVLDEADRMLDMGFLPDVRRIISTLPRKRQTLLFSATMPADIEALANTILTAPVRVAVTPVASTVEKIVQSLYFVGRDQKSALLEHVLKNQDVTRALVFTRTKRAANQVLLRLSRASIRADVIHGNKSQGARQRALACFKAGSIRVLVATDIAARGIDVDSISHVVNYELPDIPETYVHRIGRTARAGAQGAALSFCDATERSQLRDIERLIRMPVPVVAEHPFRLGTTQPQAGSSPSSSNRPRRPRFRGRGRSN